MRKTRTWPCPGVILGALLCMPVPGSAAPNWSRLVDDDHDALGKFQQALRRDGFAVNPGVVTPVDTVRLWCAGKIDNAGYANDEPYLGVFIPDPQRPQNPPSNQLQLDADEAVVMIGLTPPPARYFSYGPYLDFRSYPDGRKQPFASLGDAVNNATVNTIGNSPFNAPIALIFTPDQGTDARVRAALRSAGYPAAIINTVVFPASMLTLGHAENADVLNIVLRNGIWTNPDDGALYLANAPETLHVFRVTPAQATTANPFPAPRLRVRGTGHSEMDLMNKLEQLRHAIVDTYQKLGLDAVEIKPMPMCYEGYDLIQREVELCGDSRDAFYVAAGYMAGEPGSTDLTLGDDEFLMVYGVNHVANGKATYMNTNVYADKQAHLTVGATDDRSYSDGARRYFQDPAADLMYAYKISRTCGKDEPQCLPLSAPEDCTRLTLDSSTVLGVFTRVYLEPATKVGPALPEMLYERVIKFSPRPPKRG